MVQAKVKNQSTGTTVLYLRGTPRDVARKLKAAAALAGKSLTDYMIDLLGDHIGTLERDGTLPKSKQS